MTVPYSAIVKGLLLWFPFLLLLPLLLVAVLTLSLYKGVVVGLSKFLRKDLVGPVTGLDISFCTDDFFGRPYGGLSFVWLIDGPLQPDLLIDRLEKVMDSRHSMKYDYEKLTTVVPTFWLGYPFWKKSDKEFCVKNHVKVMEVEEEFVQPNDINKRICEWMLEPFSEGLPLWEIRVVPKLASLKLSTDAHLPFTHKRIHEKETSKKCEEVKSILILKTHHMIGDGYSMLGLLDKIVDSPKRSSIAERHQIKRKPKAGKTVVQENHPEKGQQDGFPFERESYENSNFTTGLKSTIAASIQSGIEVTKGFLCQLSNAIFLTFFTPSTLFSLLNEFGLHRDCWFTNKKVSSELNLATVSIPLKRLNDLRRDLCKSSLFSHNDERSSKIRPSPVPTIVITVSALAGALRQFFLLGQKKVLDDGQLGVLDVSAITKNVSDGLKIPEYVNFVAALPLKNKKHPGSHIFCNFWTHGILSVNTKEESSIQRLRLLNRFYHEIETARIPEIYEKCVIFHSLLPEHLLRVITSYNMGASIGVTSLMGPVDSVYIGGQKVCQKYAYSGLQWRHASMMLALFSYNGQMTVTLLANASVIPNQESVEKVLREYFLDQLALPSHLEEKAQNAENMKQ